MFHTLVKEHFWDVIENTAKPIIASHSSVYALCPVPGNLKDDQIKAIAKNRGLSKSTSIQVLLIQPKKDMKMHLWKAVNQNLIPCCL
jgi:microsomal dipeptidase-like Zn-dependent dipeptidase